MGVGHPIEIRPHRRLLPHANLLGVRGDAQRHVHHITRRPQRPARGPPIRAPHRQRRHQTVRTRELPAPHIQNEISAHRLVHSQEQAPGVLHQHQHPNRRTIHRERPWRQRPLPRPHREPRHRRAHTTLEPHRQHTRQHHRISPSLGLGLGLGLGIGNSPHHRLRRRVRHRLGRGRRVPHPRRPRTLTRNPAGQRHHPIHEQLAPNRRRLIQVRRLRRPRVRHQHRQGPLTLLRTTTQHPIPRHPTATIRRGLGRVPAQQHPTLNRNRRQTPRRARPPNISRHRTRRHHHRRQHSHHHTHRARTTTPPRAHTTRGDHRTPRPRLRTRTTTPSGAHTAQRHQTSSPSRHRPNTRTRPRPHGRGRKQPAPHPQRCGPHARASATRLRGSTAIRKIKDPHDEAPV